MYYMLRNHDLHDGDLCISNYGVRVLYTKGARYCTLIIKGGNGGTLGGMFCKLGGPCIAHEGTMNFFIA